MNSIVRGTTPVIMFTFSTIQTSSLSSAYLVIKSNGRTVIEKDIDEVEEITDDTISWKLTQQESLRLRVSEKIVVYCDWLLLDGTRGRSAKGIFIVEESGKSTVIE